MSTSVLPLVLGGPIVRRVSKSRLTFWLATSRTVKSRLKLTTSIAKQDITTDEHVNSEIDLSTFTTEVLIGQHLYLQLINVPLEEELPHNRRIYYDLQFQQEQGGRWIPSSDWAQQLCYAGYELPFFVIKSRLDVFLHGSCRRPHHPSKDAFGRIDALLASNFGQLPSEPPCLAELPTALLLTGDQVYTDDVAGPMLVAIRRLASLLGLPAESLPESCTHDAAISAVFSGKEGFYYQRDQLLPKTEANKTLYKQFFQAKKKPIFTTVNSRNHLMSFSEIMAMYLLSWSPVCWSLVTLEPPESMSTQWQEIYAKEQTQLSHFLESLPQVQRVMAHIPVAMIFDDHDVTDDWNLSAAWEQTVYGNPFSKRVIGNALAAYFLCQGWGNAPEHFSGDLFAEFSQGYAELGCSAYDAFLARLLKFRQWHYQWHFEDENSPPLVVLDTRTQRWRSEVGLEEPSGLMDWESLIELQQCLLDKDAVVLVSPAPMFGVKLIEAIQSFFTVIGKPLVVDAENWMAHPGAAYTLLNLFAHSRTPQTFMIISGDVHYSFAYQVALRKKDNGPVIWQITSSGIHNEFPKTLLEVLDRLNRWLYAPWSPLNWLTKRKKMRVTPLEPKIRSAGERLVNGSGIGLVMLNDENRPKRIAQLLSKGDDIEFELLTDDASTAHEYR